MASSLAPARAPRLSRRTRPGAGRPTREQAERRHQELLDRALELFLEKGFELATIEAIAASVGMTKRTVYARYADKPALFRAVVQHALEKWSVSFPALQSIETEDLTTTLLEVAKVRLAHAISPAGLRLQRVLNAEAYRFPDVGAAAYEQGTKPTIDYLADLFRRHTKNGTAKVAKPEVAAMAFLNMVVGGPLRAIVWGKPIDTGALEERTKYCVKLFTDGIRTR